MEQHDSAEQNKPNLKSKESLFEKPKLRKMKNGYGWRFKSEMGGGFNRNIQIISTVDTEARHGHKSKNKRFDNYKTQLSIEPESEIICETNATKANAHDHDAIEELASEIANDSGDDDKLSKVVIGDGV